LSEVIRTRGGSLWAVLQPLGEQHQYVGVDHVHKIAYQFAIREQAYQPQQAS
jgi:hypothetical protein